MNHASHRSHVNLEAFPLFRNLSFIYLNPSNYIRLASVITATEKIK